MFEPHEMETLRIPPCLVDITKKVNEIYLLSLFGEDYNENIKATGANASECDPQVLLRRLRAIRALVDPHV